jgi:anti-anti-sigma regulatory factor
VHSYLLITFAPGRRGTLRVAEDLDQAGEGDLSLRLDDAISAGCTRLDVDCSRVTRIGPEALTVLADGRARLAQGGGALVVTACSEAFTLAARRHGFEDLAEGASVRPTWPTVVRRHRAGPRRPQGTPV